MNTAYHFRLFTYQDGGRTISVGASTMVHAASQAEAETALRRQLARWEHVAPLHGPARNAYSWH
ncbi:hypothetical protein EBT31_21845 [bacterium]|jgi:hypothetical protein|nr:hypothetical protein [bacterium]